MRSRKMLPMLASPHRPSPSPSPSPSPAAAAAASPSPSPSPSSLSMAMASPNSIIEHKRSLRSRIRRELRLRYPTVSLAQDPSIQARVLDAPWYVNSSRICAYVSCPALREVGTSLIMDDIFHSARSDHPKTVYVPWIEDKQSHMKFFHITSYGDMTKNSMGILEPNPVDENGKPREDVIQSDQPIDLILLPGLAFDRGGRRLGRGGGYYDAFLKNYELHATKKGWKPPLLVGLAYSLQILDEIIPTDAKDMPIDALVTTTGVLPMSDDSRLKESCSNS